MALLLLAASCAPAVSLPDEGELFDHLSDYGPEALEREYTLPTPLFTDYAVKRRTTWGDQLLTKTFGFEVGGRVRKVETRVLVRERDGWRGAAYLWNEDETEAELARGGGLVELGGSEHLVPGAGQCKQCHGPALAPIGPDHAQLPRWDDPTSGSLEQRARAYLAVNCAHCHSATGAARTTGLRLGYRETDLRKLGICKPPIATGPATGGRRYDVVPGAPDASIVVHRLESTAPAIMMPPIGRSVVHLEGVELIRAWIASLPGTCG